MEVSGFIVVRKPEDNFNPTGVGIHPRIAPQAFGRFYSGVQRMKWFDLTVDMYPKPNRLPADIWRLFEPVNRDNSAYGTGIAVCTSRDDAEKLLAHSNTKHDKSELIALQCPTLKKIYGSFDLAMSSCTWLGWDPFQIGGGALLVDGIFAAEAYFQTWRHRLNRHGLFDTRDDALDYIDEHQRLIESGSLEEIFPCSIYPIEPIEIVRLG